MNIIDKLIDGIYQKQNPTVLGLDTQVSHLPQDLLANIDQNNAQSICDGIFEYNKMLVDNLKDIIPAVKVQIAYYELFGAQGMQLFIDTVKYAKNAGMITIADAKRNDIGSTAQAYSSAFLGETSLVNSAFSVIDSDMVTVNPYLGTDGIQPFLDDCKKYDKGIFVLVKTSNPSSGEFQNLKCEDGKYLYEHVALKVEDWGEELLGESGYSSVGAVVGATYPQESGVLRKLMPRTFFLVPGYGAQGGTAQSLLPSFDEFGSGAIVNASRSILAAHKKSDLPAVEAAKAEALRMKADLLSALGGKIKRKG